MCWHLGDFCRQTSEIMRTSWQVVPDLQPIAPKPGKIACYSRKPRRWTGVKTREVCE
jgi:hypothetical protein